MNLSCGHEPRSDFRYLAFSELAQPHPVSAIVFLHGSGERGSDLSDVARYGLPAMLSQGRASTSGAVLCPQLEAGREWDPERVATFIRSIDDQYSTKVLMGFSLGGSGVCEVLSAVGAIVPLAIVIAGRGPSRVQADQTGVRVLSIRGDLDDWPDMQSFLSGVQSSGGQVHEVELAGQGHFISETALDDPSVSAMLLDVGLCLKIVHALARDHRVVDCLRQGEV